MKPTIEELSARLIPPGEACRLLKLKRQSLYNKMSTGKIRRIKVAGKIYCDKSQIEKILRTALEA